MRILKETKKNEHKQQPEEKYRDLKMTQILPYTETPSRAPRPHTLDFSPVFFGQGQQNLLGKICSVKALSSPGTGWAGQWWRHQPRIYSRGMQMWCLAMSFSGGLAGAGLIIGLRGSFQTKQVCNSISDSADIFTTVYNLNLELSHNFEWLIYGPHLNKAWLWVSGLLTV